MQNARCKMQGGLYIFHCASFIRGALFPHPGSRLPSRGCRSIPPTAERLIELRERDQHRALCLRGRELRVEQLALRVEHLEERAHAASIPQRRELEGALVRRDECLFRRELLSRALI